MELQIGCYFLVLRLLFLPGFYRSCVSILFVFFSVELYCQWFRINQAQQGAADLFILLVFGCGRAREKGGFRSSCIAAQRQNNCTLRGKVPKLLGRFDQEPRSAWARATFWRGCD